MTTRLIIGGVVLATVGLILFGHYLIVFRGFLPGYRGAIGFVPLASIPSNLKDGEIFFVFSEARGWTVESSPELRLDQLLHGK